MKLIAPDARRARVAVAVTLGCALVTLLAATRDSRPASLAGGAKTSPTTARSGYAGTLTFSTTGNGDPFHPVMVQELDLGSSAMTVRFDGLDATRARSGEV